MPRREGKCVLSAMTRQSVMPGPGCGPAATTHVVWVHEVNAHVPYSDSISILLYSYNSYNYYYYQLQLHHICCAQQRWN